MTSPDFGAVDFADFATPGWCAAFREGFAGFVDALLAIAIVSVR
jgi:hypothetical protein